jgi:hypothetical protein
MRGKRMKTIVKGNIVKNTYYVDLYRLNENLRWQLYTIKTKDEFYNIIEYLNEYMKSQDKYINIISEVIDYESFFESDTLDYTLKTGNYIFIDNLNYRIEKVEGTDTNSIIYYTNNIIKVVDDKNSLDKALKERNDFFNSYINTFNNRIMEIENSKKKLGGFYGYFKNYSNNR